MPTSPARVRVARWAPLAVFLLAAGLYAASISESASVDVVSAGLASWRIAETGLPWVDGLDLSWWAGTPPDPDRIFVHPGTGEHLVPWRSPGVVLAAVPAYLLAGLGASEASFAVWPGSLSAALLSAGTVTLFFLYARRHAAAPVALLATAVLGLASPVWSVAADAMWTHTLTALGLAGMAWAADGRRWWLVGLFGGVALWGRPHVALVVAVVGLGVAWSRRHPAIAVRVGLASGACLFAASLWTKALYDSWLPTGGYEVTEFLGIAGGRSLAGSLENQVGVWVAPYAGVLVWSPVLLLLAPAMARCWPHAPDHVRWAVVGTVAYTSLQVYLLDFTGGDAFFGYRLGIEVLLALSLLAVHALPHTGRLARALLGPLVGAQLAVFVLGSTLEGFVNATGDPWTTNAFVDAGADLPALWGVVAMGAVLGSLAARSWPREWAPATPPAVPRPVPEPV